MEITHIKHDVIKGVNGAPDILSIREEVESLEDYGPLSGMVGQAHVTDAMTPWVAALIAGHGKKSALVSGPAGMGKDRFTGSACHDLANAGFRAVKVSAQDLLASVDVGKRTAPAPVMERLCDLLSTGEPMIVWVEEAHHILMPAYRCPHDVAKCFRRALGKVFGTDYPAGFRETVKGSVGLSFFPDCQAFIFTSKEPRLIDDDLRGQRLENFELSSRYRPEEVKEMLDRRLASEGIRETSKAAANLLAEAARYNARALMGLGDKAVSIAQAKDAKRPSLTREDAIAAIKANSSYLWGLAYSEVDILRYVESGPRPVDALASHLSVKNSDVRGMCGYLIERGYIDRKGHSYFATEDGKTALSILREYSFKF